MNSNFAKLSTNKSDLMIRTQSLQQTQRTAAGWPPLRPAEQVNVNRVLLEWCLTHSLNERPLDGLIRLWLVLRALDRDGRGWLRFEDVATTLTHQDSPYFLLHRDALREVLEAGNGIFWNQYRAKGRADGELRIYLCSHARIRKVLGCDFLHRSAEQLIPTTSIIGNWPVIE